MHNTGKKVKPLNTSGWQFPKIAKPFPVYSLGVKKASKIISDLEERYSFNNSEKGFQVKFDELIQCSPINLNETERISEAPEGTSHEIQRHNSCVTIPERHNSMNVTIPAKIEPENARSAITDAENIKQINESESKIKLMESESMIETNALEEKYFRKWLFITRRKIEERAVSFRKNLFGRNIFEPVDLEEELWKKWKQTENEIAEMKSILFLHWTSYSNIDYSFEYARYLKVYKRNPLKWMDSKHCESSCGLEVRAIQRWIKIEETYEKLKEHFSRNYKSQLQDQKKGKELFIIQKQKEYFSKMAEIKRSANLDLPKKCTTDGI